jgi:DNA-binding MarR family transcriptional regulator
MLAGMGADRIDALVAQWAGERPDLDLEAMALVARLMHVTRLATDRLVEGAARYGVNKGEGDVLFALRRSGAPFRLSPSQLSAALLVSSGTMTNRLDRLEERGLIERAPDPCDRRSLQIGLTAAGRKLADEAVGEHVANEQHILAPLSERERDQLARLTRKLLAHLEAGPGGAGTKPA